MEMVWIQNLKSLITNGLFCNDEQWKAIFLRELDSVTELQAEIDRLRTGIKRLSDEEELCFETTADDPFSMVYLAAKLAASEEARAEQWRLRREAEGSRDASYAAADSMRIERDALRGLVERAQAIISTSTYPNWHASACDALAATTGEYE